jgi:Pyruvate/2-oxoacid:ferredoxin oxidoreductase delta subunit
MGYRRATFYFYSGTGNSRRVAVWMADAADDAGSAVTLGPIESARPEGQVGQGEEAVLGLVMPTHGFTTPWTMLRFVFRLPRRSKTHAVIVATRGGLKIGRLYTPGFEGTATLLVALILVAKGYRIRGMAGVDMPSNWLALHPSLPPRAVDGIISRARAKTARLSDIILSGKRRLGNWLAPVFGLLVLPISLGYLVIGRLFLAKLFFASDRCTGCALCAEHCPNGAIEMRGTEDEALPYWTFRCESCMRCIAYCPVQAVQASHLLAIGFYLLARVMPTAAALAWVTARIPPFSFLRHIPRWIVLWINALATLALAYPLFHLLLRVHPFNWFFTHTTLTQVYRRYHEPATTLEELEWRERYGSETLDVSDGEQRTGDPSIGAGRLR